MDVLTYKLEEIESHLIPSFSRSSGTLSLSPLRLSSYLKNPRSVPTDIVLIELHRQGELIAYRTLLPDHFVSGDGQLNRFAWLSGNWVHPDFRRQGISTQLLNSAEQAWNGRLMYTNYAPASKAVYDKSSSYRPVALRRGKRFYLRAASEELLGKRMGGRQLFKSCDRIINKFREEKLSRLEQRAAVGYSIEHLNGFDEESRKLIAQMQGNSLFQRNAEVFEWALAYPWITHKEVPALNYHFTYKANRFENILLKFRDQDNGKVGVMWLIQHNNVISVPYAFAESKAIYSHMAIHILRSMISSGSTHATLRCPDLVNKLWQLKGHFLLVRNMPQQIFAHATLEGQIPDNLKIHDGDGDVMFTG